MPLMPYRQQQTVPPTSIFGGNQFTETYSPPPGLMPGSLMGQQPLTLEDYGPYGPEADRIAATNSRKQSLGQQLQLQQMQMGPMLQQALFWLLTGGYPVFQSGQFRGFGKMPGGILGKPSVPDVRFRDQA